MADKEKAAAAEASGEATAKESKIAPKPEGYMSPYHFTAVLSQHLGKEIRPQTVYGMVRNQPKLKDGTPFPVEKNTDGKYMINAEAALAWFDQRQQERAAAKAAKAEAAASNDKEAAAAE